MFSKEDLTKKQQVGCYACDLLVEHPPLAKGQQAFCPRCGHHLRKHDHDPNNRSLAFALSGLILFFPAMFSPLLGLEILGIQSIVSIREAISIIYRHQLYVVSSMVLIFIVAIPLFQLLFISTLLISLKFNAKSQRWKRAFRYYFYLKQWVMLDVFILGIVVALYKLTSLATVIFGVGLLAFSVLIFCSICASSLLNEYEVWSTIEMRDAGANA